MKKIKLAVVLTTCCAALALVQSNALALSFADSNTLGHVTPGTPIGATDAEGYINQLITMSPGTAATIDGNNFNRSVNVFASLPEAVFADEIAYSEGDVVPAMTIHLGDGGYTYLLAKYASQSFGSEVWYIGGLTGDITIPGYSLPEAMRLKGGNGGSNGNALSHIKLFTPGSSVPDGGLTLLMLGSALAGLGTISRRLRK